MINKRRNKDKVRVTFTLPENVDARRAHVVGDFNDWSPSTPMKKGKEGVLQVAVDLEPGREYQFRYVIDGERWINDPQADAHVANPFGSENSVVRAVTAEAGARAARPAAAGRSAAARGDAKGAGGAARGPGRAGAAGGRSAPSTGRPSGAGSKRGAGRSSIDTASAQHGAQAARGAGEAAEVRAAPAPGTADAGGATRGHS
ncbi:MAG TPA: isoamylase early set domain-containing protein [Longimicrobiales bacterium]|nr:isoamylase early set domain-containing protein [Longimicrobiales bacterium]